MDSRLFSDLWRLELNSEELAGFFSLMKDFAEDSWRIARGLEMLYSFRVIPVRLSREWLVLRFLIELQWWDWWSLSLLELDDMCIFYFNDFFHLSLEMENMEGEGK